MKVESCSSNKQVLKMEVAVLKRLQNCSSHICEFVGCGRNSKVNYLVMSLLGPNLSELRKHQPHQKFSISTTLRVGIQIVAAVQSMHDCGFLHRDIKPSNFAIGDTPETSRTCYMLDYGLARQYTTVTGEVRQPRSVAGFRGTVRYASVNAHLSRDLGRHDDLWSVLYMLIELAVGHLPWRKIKDKEEAGEFKSQYDHKKLLRGLPTELNDILDHLRCSSYFDKPDYQLVNEALLRAINRLSIQESDPYDWEQDFSAPSVTTASMVSPPAVKLVHEEKGAEMPSPMRTQPEPSRTNCSGVADLSDGHSEGRDRDERNKEFLRVPRPYLKSAPPGSNQVQDVEDPEPAIPVVETNSNQPQAPSVEISIDHKLKENLNITNRYISDEEDNEHYRDAVSSEGQCLSPHPDVSHKETSGSLDHRSSLRPHTGGGGGVTPMKSYQTESLNRFYDMDSVPKEVGSKGLSRGRSEEGMDPHTSSQYFSRKFRDTTGSSKSDVDLLNNAMIYPENPDKPELANGFSLIEEGQSQREPSLGENIPHTLQQRPLILMLGLDESDAERSLSKPPVKSEELIATRGQEQLSAESMEYESAIKTQESGLQVDSRVQSSEPSISLDKPKVNVHKSRSRESIIKQPANFYAESVESEDNSSQQSGDHNQSLRKLAVCQLMLNSHTTESESSRSIEMLFAQKTQNTDFTNQAASDDNRELGSGSHLLSKLDVHDVEDQGSSQPELSSAVQLITNEDIVKQEDDAMSRSPAGEKKPTNIHVTVSEYTGRNSLAKLAQRVQVLDDHSTTTDTHSSGRPARQTKSASNFLEVSPKTMRLHPRPPPNPPPLNYSVSLTARRRRFVRHKKK